MFGASLVKRNTPISLWNTNKCWCTIYNLISHSCNFSAKSHDAHHSLLYQSPPTVHISSATISRETYFYLYDGYGVNLGKVWTVSLLKSLSGDVTERSPQLPVTETSLWLVEISPKHLGQLHHPKVAMTFLRKPFSYRDVSVTSQQRHWQSWRCCEDMFKNCHGSPQDCCWGEVATTARDHTEIDSAKVEHDCCNFI